MIYWAENHISDVVQERNRPKPFSHPSRLLRSMSTNCIPQRNWKLANKQPTESERSKEPAASLKRVHFQVCRLASSTSSPTSSTTFVVLFVGIFAFLSLWSNKCISVIFESIERRQVATTWLVNFNSTCETRLSLGAHSPTAPVCCCFFCYISNQAFPLSLQMFVTLLL